MTCLVTQESKTVEAAIWKQLGIGQIFKYNTPYNIILHSSIAITMFLVTPFSSMKSKLVDILWVTWVVTQESKTVEAAIWKQLGIGLIFTYSTPHFDISCYEWNCDVIQLHQVTIQKSVVGDLVGHPRV